MSHRDMAEIFLQKGFDFDFQARVSCGKFRHNAAVVDVFGSQLFCCAVNFGCLYIFDDPSAMINVPGQKNVFIAASQKIMGQAGTALNKHRHRRSFVLDNCVCRYGCAQINLFNLGGIGAGEQFLQYSPNRLEKIAPVNWLFGSIDNTAIFNNYRINVGASHIQTYNHETSLLW